MIDKELLDRTKEYANQYRAVKDSFARQKQVFESTKNSTELFFRENYSSESRMDMIEKLKESDCPKPHIMEMVVIHERITEEFKDDFEIETCKQALFTFSSLVNQAHDLIDSTNSGVKKSILSSFLAKK
ncbi:hypothetical protein OCE54_09140 [Bacillus cereus]|nr:hypothetical protein [Bacillus cereus]